MTPALASQPRLRPSVGEECRMQHPYRWILLWTALSLAPTAMAELHMCDGQVVGDVTWLESSVDKLPCEVQVTVPEVDPSASYLDLDISEEVFTDFAFDTYVFAENIDLQQDDRWTYLVVDFGSARDRVGTHRLLAVSIVTAPSLSGYAVEVRHPSHTPSGPAHTILLDDVVDSHWVAVDWNAADQQLRLEVAGEAVSAPLVLTSRMRDAPTRVGLGLLRPLQAPIVGSHIRFIPIGPSLVP